MVARCLIVIVLIAALSIFSACGATKLDKNWGKSFESAKFNQMLNPEAGQTPKPVVGLDGQAAEKTLGTYRKGFEPEASEEMYNLNLGSIDSIGKK